MLVVLFIVMAVSVVSLGYLTRSDSELSSGSNMLMHTQMRYLAESAIIHAQGLLLNPQDSSGEYFTADSALQLVAGTDDYYDLTVTRDDSDSTDRCTYDVTCTAYRMVSGEQLGQIALDATLRLDPCIAFYCEGDSSLSGRVTINGDAYINGDLYNKADINGDVFADSYSRVGSIKGGEYSLSQVSGVTSPALNPTSYSAAYATDAEGKVELVDQTLVFTDTFAIHGDLVLDGGSLTITAPKNTPAMLIAGDVILKNRATLNVTGYAQIAGGIDAGNKTAVNILGALHLTTAGLIDIDDTSPTIDDRGTVTVTAAPMLAAMRLSGSPVRNFSPAAGAFIKSIDRQ